MKKIFNILFLLINFIFIGLFLLSGLATEINPEKFVLPSYLSLFFTPLLIINIFTIFFWAIRLKWYLVFSLLAIGLVWGNVRNNLPIHSSSANELAVSDSTRQISVLSYNVKLFDFYKKNNSATNCNQTLDYIISRNADVVCLQEFGYYNSNAFLSADDIISTLEIIYPYYQVVCHLSNKGRNTYGVATFSKFPIINKQEIKYGSTYNRTIFSDIEIDTTIIRVFNCHLESNQLTIDDKKKMVELMDSTSQEKLSEATTRLTRKLGAASRKRSHQAEAIAVEIAKSPYPVVACGDFNDTPISFTYKKIKGDLTDVFATTSSGLGITYAELPFLYRIDYIFHSKELKSGDFKIDKVSYSDHYPISCKIQF